MDDENKEWKKGKKEIEEYERLMKERKKNDNIMWVKEIGNNVTKWERNCKGKTKEEG